jgi:uncharacterized protein
MMSKTTSYLTVAIAAFLVGGFSFRLVGLGGEASLDRKQSESQKAAPGTDASTTRQFTIEGMTCQGCVDSVTSALKQIPGVQSASVSLKDKRAVVVASPSEVPTEKILAAVAAAGYKARSMSASGPATPAIPKQPVLVNITRGKAELHAVSMAIGLARSALNDGRPVTVFLNVEAPVFAAKDLSDKVKFADFPPVKKMLADFTAAGGRVLVCGHCAHVAKLDQQHLIDGAEILGHGELLAKMPPGTVVFSY